MNDQKTCAHSPCRCAVTNDDFGDYCSSHCQNAKDLAELRCECGHAPCKA